MLPAGDMQRGMRMPSRNAPGAIAPDARMPFDDVDDIDIDADFRHGGNARNRSGYVGDVGTMSMRGNMERIAGGMGEDGTAGGMMMNRMGGMMAGGLMGGIGGMGGMGGVGVGVGPMGLMGGNLDGLSRLASTMGQMNVMHGNLQGMAGADGNMKRVRDSMERGRGGMERGRGNMERGRGIDGRMRREDGPGSKHDMSTGLHRESDSGGTVVFVRNMNQEVHNTHSHSVYCISSCRQ